MKIALLLLAVLFGACSAAPPRQEDLSTEVDDGYVLVWQSLMGRSDAPPKVEWVAGEKCGDLRDPAIVVGNVCAGGTFANATGIVTLVEPVRHAESNVQFGRLSASAIAHEFTHAYLAREYGNSDDGHSDFPDRWELVPQINDWLRLGGE